MEASRAYLDAVIAEFDAASSADVTGLTGLGVWEVLGSVRRAMALAARRDGGVTWTRAVRAVALRALVGCQPSVVVVARVAF